MATTNVGVEYRATPLSEALTPELSYQQHIKTSTLIKDRVNNIIYPKTGQTNYVVSATNKPVIEFQVSNTAFTDPSTACLLIDCQLSFDAGLTLNGAGNALIANDLNDLQLAMADSMCPFFQQVQTMVNSSLIENITDCDLLTFWKQQWTQPRDTYRTKTRFATQGNGRWSEYGQYNVAGSIATEALAGVAQADFFDAWDAYVVNATVPDPAGAPSVYLSPVVQLVVPLAPFLAIFSGSSYLPPMTSTNINLRMYSNEIQRIFSIAKVLGNQIVGPSPAVPPVVGPPPVPGVPQGTNPTILSVSLNNIRLSYDAVITSPAVEESMASLMGAGSKIYYPLIHHRVQNDIVNRPPGSTGVKQYLLNCGTSNLVSLYQYHLKDTQLTTQIDPLSYMPNPGMGSLSASPDNRYYIMVGSKQFPSANQVQGANAVFLELLKSLGDSPFLTEPQYYYPISALDTGIPPLAGATLNTQGRTGMFCLGMNFERLIGGVAQTANAGISTRGVSGLIQSWIGLGSVEAPTPQTASCRESFRLISVMLYLEYLIIESGGILSTNV